MIFKHNITNTNGIGKILSNRPPWMIRRGCYILYIVLFVFIYFILSINYPDICECQIDNIEYINPLERKICLTISSNTQIKDFKNIENKIVYLNAISKGKIIDIKKTRTSKLQIIILLLEKPNIKRIKEYTFLVIYLENSSLIKRLFVDKNNIISN